MLSLNSYGISRSPCSSKENRQLHASHADATPFVLPRLPLSPTSPHQPVGHTTCLPHLGGRIKSLGEESIQMNQEGRDVLHPLYFTTAGYDYGRFIGLHKAPQSCPKHSKQTGFTRTFCAGTFADTSLSSVDKSKVRAAAWQRKMAERTKQMQQKYEEFQINLELKKQHRREQREHRRLEAVTRNDAAITIQAIFRGFATRKELIRKNDKKRHQAAIKIQKMCHSRIQIRHAKQVLASRKKEMLDIYANKLQHCARNHLDRLHARQELELRRRSRQQMLEESLNKQRVRAKQAVTDIQRVYRGYATRRRMLREGFFITTMGSTRSMGTEKDDREVLNKKSKYSKRAQALASLRRKKDRSTQRLVNSTSSGSVNK